MKCKQIIGILGGMGPYATIDVYKLILDSIKVKKEWEYPHVIITSNPKMPSRTRAFLFGEKSPVNDLVREAKRLKKAGADFIIVPCNSAHYFLDDIRRNVDIEILDMVKITAKYIHLKFPKIKKVAVLGGEVTLRGGLYDKALKRYGIKAIKPGIEDEKIMRAGIDMIKHNKVNKKDYNALISLAKRLIKEGAEAIILGCTEYPILFRNIKLPARIIDSNRVVVEYAIKKAGY